MTATQNIQERANASYENAFGKDGWIREQLEQLDQAEEQNDYDTGEEVRQQMLEHPLAIDKLITDHRNAEIEWEILLSTGGPASRVVVRTDLKGWKIESAEYQFQDWFEPWTAAEDQDEDIVRRYAEIVGYYEQID